MPRNVEIKAQIDSIESILPIAASLSSSGPETIIQDDTFFTCSNGRLKLRSFSDDNGELIYYRRANKSGPKESFYIRSETTDPVSLRQSLTLAYGQSGRVVKRRILFLVGRTRIHLDDVEGLGHFLELEVVLNENEELETGIREAQLLMEQLGVDPAQLVESAYVDLLP